MGLFMNDSERKGGNKGSSDRVRIDEEKGLQPPKDVPEMPDVKPPKSEKGN